MHNIIFEHLKEDITLIHNKHRFFSKTHVNNLKRLG